MSPAREETWISPGTWFVTVPSGYPQAVIANRYALGALVGTGGMAEVHRATDHVLEREVAVKLLRAPTADETARARFDGEARTLAALNHPGLVTVLDAGTHQGRPFLVMELIDGPTLSERLRADGPLDAEQVRTLGIQLAEALAYAHEHGVIHRDVKPSNILLRTDGSAVLTDFGIARLVSDASAHTQTGEVIGSPAYLSPEQVNGSAPTTAVDVYALGLVLLEGLTNVRAYPGTPIEAALARLTTPPPFPDSLDPRLRDLLSRMTALAPPDRPSALEVATTLRALEPGVRDPAATAVLELGPIQERSRRPVAALLVAAGVVVALAVAGLAQLASDPVEAGPASPTSAASTPAVSTPAVRTPTATSTQRPTVAAVTKATPPPKAKAPAKPPAKKKAPAKGKGPRKKV